MTAAELILFSVAVIATHGLLGVVGLFVAYRLENSTRARWLRHLPNNVEVPY